VPKVITKLAGGYLAKEFYLMLIFVLFQNNALVQEKPNDAAGAGQAKIQKGSELEWAYANYDKDGNIRPKDGNIRPVA
jgi:hypothetical protein